MGPVRNALAVLLAAFALGCGAEGNEPGPGTGFDAAAGAPAPLPDAAVPDAGDDAGSSAEGGTDAAADAAFGDPDAGDPDAGAPELPESLAETGLYRPGSTTELADGVQPFTPRYALWSDGADKRRYVFLPDGAVIDTSDMDAWLLPVGTKLWKEFSLDGKRLETRLLWKTETGWRAIAFAWNEDESEALAAPRGAQNVRGTEHDVPRRSACGECHDGRPDTVLGFSAIQLAHAGPGVTLQSLVDNGRLSAPPSAELALPDEPAWNALGYLHANCGNCHNPSSITWDKLDLDLWLRTAELAEPSATQSHLSTVSVPLTETGDGGMRVEPGDAAASGLIVRMTTRGDELAMPPLASERVDDAGVALVSEWIDGL